MKKRKFVRKFTAFNVLANIFLILFLVLDVVSVLFVKFASKLGGLADTLDGILPGISKNPYIKTWASDYISGGWADADGLVAKLILVAIGIGALLVFILSMCFAKHGKGWNIFSWLLTLADTGWFVYLAKQEGIFTDFKVFDFASRTYLKSPTDINLFAHVIVFFFLTFALFKGTKKIQAVDSSVEPEAAEEKEEEPVYRTITLTRKVAPFCRGQQFECWFNGERLSTIGDGQEKSFLVDRYGAELVVVSPDGAESNIINIPEGEDNANFTISTSRNASGILAITVA